MDHVDSGQRHHHIAKVLLAGCLTIFCIIALRQSSGFNGSDVFSKHELGVTHVLVTGGAGYIGSHAVFDF